MAPRGLAVDPELEDPLNGQKRRRTATISVAFSADFYSASINSTKGVSHYDVTQRPMTSTARRPRE